LLIQNDLQRIFEFIEPSDDNLDTHSFRIHELFMCVFRRIPNTDSDFYRTWIPENTER